MKLGTTFADPGVQSREMLTDDLLYLDRRFRSPSYRWLDWFTTGSNPPPAKCGATVATGEGITFGRKTLFPKESFLSFGIGKGFVIALESSF
jgi:hypothetical protein